MGGGRAAVLVSVRGAESFGRRRIGLEVWMCIMCFSRDLRGTRKRGGTMRTGGIEWCGGGRGAGRGNVGWIFGLLVDVEVIGWVMNCDITYAR